MNCFSLLPGSASRSQFWPPELRELAHVLISKKEVTRTKKLHLQTDECSDAGIKSNVGPSISFSELKSYVSDRQSETCSMVISFRICACCTHSSRPCEIATGRRFAAPQAVHPSKQSARHTITDFCSRESWKDAEVSEKSRSSSTRVVRR